MAVKGQGFVKTTWSFEERPVASSKLNSWDDRIERAIELVFLLLNHAWGEGDGVIRTNTGTDLKVTATTTPGLSVEVQPGYGFISGSPYKLAAALETVDVVAPTTNPRIDLVQARLDTWDVSIVTGTEAAMPSAPIAEADALPLAELYLRPGMTVIKNSDDATNGYIDDVRSYL
jgi:hypothetical protein